MKLSIEQGKIGPQSIPGWDLQDVADLGNCFYDAVAHQMQLIKHPLLSQIPQGTLSRDSLRLRIQGGAFQDKEWADEQHIDKLVKELDVVLVVADTRTPENGFIAYSRSENGEVTTHFPGDGIPLPDKSIIRLVTTGNHFLSVMSNPPLLRGCLLSSFAVPQ